MVAAHELLLLRWNANLTRGPHDEPLISPLFVAEQGPGIRIADVRPRDEATGVLGYIPGSEFCGLERLERLTQESTSGAPLVLVSATGGAAANVARRLAELGMQNVAAMAGGIAAWRGLGISTSRDPDGVLDAIPDAAGTSAEDGPFTLERVREHVGNPRAVRWIKLPSLIAQWRMSCIDGRDERGVVGSPGGDGGEFLLGLAAIESATGRKLDEETVTRGLLAHLDTFGHFYKHTDAHALEALIGALQTDDRLASAVSGLARPEQWFEFLRDPAPEFRDALLEHLVEPDHIGCGHIRLMVQHSEEYGTRRELVISFLRAFFRLWWAGAPELELTLLPGHHGEGAVVNVRLAEGVWGLSRIPLVSPACGGQQMFINHPEVSSFLRRATVQYLVKGSGPLGIEPSQESELQAAIDELAARQMGVTVGYLAKGLPVFDVVFSADGSFDVRSQ